MKYKQIIAMAALLGALTTGCKHVKDPGPSNETEQYCIDKEFKDRIEISTPDYEPVKEEIHLTGNIDADPDKVISFVSMNEGIIAATHFSLGDKVEKGQVLAELRSADLSSLQSQLEIINSQIAVAEKNLQSVQAMYNDGISSQKNLLEAKSELDKLRSDKQRIASSMSIFSASPEKGVFLIKAPFSGIITEKNITAGTPISGGGEPLFTIADLSEVWLLVNIYTTNVDKIQPGQDITFRTLSYPDKVFSGKIASISQIFDEDEKVLKARVVINNKDLKLKPGMFADVNVNKTLDSSALAIPTKALIFDNNQNFVLVYRNDCDFEIRRVELLTKSGNHTFIAKGLTANDKIVSKNQLLIYERINK
ncbi:MAG: efflux RND transporter periplasmic adaptor subunit [Bacteroidia bacterium]|nr:efflux RND transporter periplasmic adaptor subunit [Bacteroidia bacterium]MCO5252958.1 efflux RND transporter periplasmic adaptor subunit [Bacteroidota bacterium]